MAKCNKYNFIQVFSSKGNCNQSFSYQYKIMFVKLSAGDSTFKTFAGVFKACRKRTV